MRAIDPTNGRGRLLIWATCVAFFSSTAVWAQDSARSADEATPSADPVDLCAHRIRVWQVGTERWIYLEGEVAVLQGVDGLHAEKAIVRVSADPSGKPDLNRFEAYAEGSVRLTSHVGKPKLEGRARLTMRAKGDERLKPYVASGLVRLKNAPKPDPFLRRAFPTADPVPVSAPMPTPAPAPPDSTPRVDDKEKVAEQVAPDGPIVTLGEPVSSPEPKARPRDESVSRTKVPDDPLSGSPFESTRETQAIGPPEADVIDVPVIEDRPAPPTILAPLPDQPIVEEQPADAPAPAGEIVAPILYGSQAIINVYPRNAGNLYRIRKMEDRPDGQEVYLITGGVNLVVNDPKKGTVDLSADSVVIWRDKPAEGENSSFDPEQGIVKDEKRKMQVYMEGNVVFLQDERKVAGNGDQRSYLANRAYYDVDTKRFVGLDAELDLFVPGLIAPMRVASPQIDQYATPVVGPDGVVRPGPLQTRAERSVSTGSRFANPGYRFNSRSIDLNQFVNPLVDPNTRKTVGNPRDPNAPKDIITQIDARQNVFFIGAIPAFYWPRLVTNPDDLDPPLRNFGYSYGNYFGHQVLTDWNGFKLFGIKKPKPNNYFNIDNWNVDIDYLSMRGPALGSELGWTGSQLFSGSTRTGPHFGYLDFWGIRDTGQDVLGSGPAIITNGPPGAGKAHYQRSKFPSFQTFRGRVNFRQMQSLLPADASDFEDFRIQLEAAYISDRHFLEQYYKRLFETGMDQETLAYGIRQKDNWAVSVLTEVNLQNWYTDTQWLPKVDYYRLGDSWLGNRLTYFQNSGVDYANTHTASEVNNPNIFAFLPRDPVSNTSRSLQTGRLWTSHEIDLPMNFDFIRIVPYAQGQLVGWNNQIAGNAVGRAWGAGGLRASMLAWKRYPWIDSELLNIHGINNKIEFNVDARAAFSNVGLNRIGVQDDLDDNTPEFVRRYFALTQYTGGLLPAQYDPRLLTLRRAISPITGTTDIQASMDTVRMGIHQRVQTKRGPDGQRRVIDYLTFDVGTTYFPNSQRDNFGKPFGQNTYNSEWFIGDRTSIVSTGWFEFFDVTGNPINPVSPRHRYDPFGLKVVTTGISMSRPPRANLFIGYSIINTGPITTSAINASYSYWLSPKWYSTFGTMYDFGNGILLNSTFSVTKIGADFLTSVGLAVDPQRQNYTFGFEITPRLSPNIRFGSQAGGARLDPRYAPTQ